MVKKQQRKQPRGPMANNPYVQWPAGDAALDLALKGPLPSKELINSKKSQQLLKDILS